jgi:sulfite exporter TauE/SafE
MYYWTAFLLGLVGSLHCAAMCGPLALALPATGNSRSGFVAGRAAYNLGRLITYGLLGLVFGLLGKTLVLAGIQRWVSIGLGLALLLGLAGSKKLALSRPVTALVGRLKSGMSLVLHRRSLTSLSILGLLNGLLPCGLVYVACAGATTTSSAFTGAQYMTAFGIGTLPMMLGIGLFGRLVPLSLRLQLRKAIPASVALLATLLILRGMSLGIPYVSPNLSAESASCCHK